jgi:hypothetical protein
VWKDSRRDRNWWHELANPACIWGWSGQVSTKCPRVEKTQSVQHITRVYCAQLCFRWGYHVCERDARESNVTAVMCIVLKVDLSLTVLIMLTKLLVYSHQIHQLRIVASLPCFGLGFRFRLRLCLLFRLSLLLFFFLFLFFLLIFLPRHLFRIFGNRQPPLDQFDGALYLQHKETKAREKGR